VANTLLEHLHTGIIRGYPSEWSTKQQCDALEQQVKEHFEDIKQALKEFK
jgi:hypothetical protein